MRKLYYVYLYEAIAGGTSYMNDISNKIQKLSSRKSKNATTSFFRKADLPIGFGNKPPETTTFSCFPLMICFKSLNFSWTQFFAVSFSFLDTEFVLTSPFGEIYNKLNKIKPNGETSFSRAKNKPFEEMRHR